MLTPKIVTDKGVLQRGAELDIHLSGGHVAEGGMITILLERENILEAFASQYEASEWKEIGEFFGAALMKLLAISSPAPDQAAEERYAERRKTFKKDGLPKIIKAIDEAIGL